GGGELERRGDLEAEGAAVAAAGEREIGHVGTHHRADFPRVRGPFDSLYSHRLARVAAGVPHLRPAEPAFNAERTLVLARRASEANAATPIFPAPGISAYAIADPPPPPP